MNAYASDDDRLARFVFLGLVGLLAWAPLPLASNRPWSSALLTLLAALLLAFWTVAALRRPVLMRLSARHILPAALLFLAGLGWCFVQASGLTPASWDQPVWEAASRALGRPLSGAVSADPEATVGGALRLLAYGAVFWVAAQLCRSSDNARRLVLALAWIGGAYAVYGLLVFMTGNQTILFDRKWAYLDALTSSFVSHSSYGAYAGIGLLASLAMMLEIGRDRVTRLSGGRSPAAELVDSLPPGFYLLAFNGMLLGTAMLLSHSRGALVVTVVGIVVMLVALGIGWRKRRRSVLAVGAVILLGGLVLIETSGGVTLGRMLQLDEQGTGREAIHALTGRMIEAAPMTGHGLGTFPQVFYQFRDDTFPWTSPRFAKAHNTYLELAMEIGIPAFLLIISGIGMIVGTLVAGVFRRRRNTIYPCLALGATALLGVHALYDFSIQMPAIAATYAALLGVGYAQSWRTGAGQRPSAGQDQAGGRRR